MPRAGDPIYLNDRLARVKPRRVITARRGVVDHGSEQAIVSVCMADRDPSNAAATASAQHDTES